VKLSKWQKRGLRFLFMTIVTALMLFPIVWITLTAFRPAADAFSPTLPSGLTLANFEAILRGDDYARYTANSLWVAGWSTILSLAVGGLAGYAFARYSYRGFGLLFGLVFLLRTLPPITVVIPLFFLIKFLGLYDTFTGLLLPYVAIHVAFATWIMRGFFEQIPRELEEAARIDGCSAWGAFLRVIVPVSYPGFIAAGTLVFLYDWNAFLFAVILTGTERTKLLPLAIAQKAQEFGLQWELMTAAAVLAMAPAFVIVLVAQKYIVRGLTLGAVKG